MNHTTLYRLLSSSISGRVISMGEDASEYEHDFGNLRCRRPKIVVKAQCETDVSQTFKIATEHKIPVTIRGVGHSCNGQVLTDGIVIVNHSPERCSELKILDGGLIQIPTCVTWEKLETSLNARGLSFPVLTSLLKTTIGGTLSVGGFGVRSLSYGGQIDQVVRFKLVLPNGDSVWCSEEENRDHFRFGLASLGALGMIETVVLRTIPYHPYSSIQSKPLAKNIKLDQALEQFLGMLQSKGGPDWIEMPILYPFLQDQCHGNIEYGRESQNKPSENVLKDHHLRRGELFDEKFNGRILNYANLWVDYVIRDDLVIEFAKFLQEQLKGVPHLAKDLFGICFLAVKRPAHAPDLFFHPAKKKEELYLSFGIYFEVYEDERKKIPEIKDLLGKLQKKCIELNGRPYFYGVSDDEEINSSQVYGPEIEHFFQLKKRHDPNGILKNGIFIS